MIAARWCSLSSLVVQAATFTALVSPYMWEDTKDFDAVAGGRDDAKHKSSSVYR